MDLAIAQGFLEEVNAKTDGHALLKRIGYAPDKIQSVGDSIKAFCPIHKDKKFRSLLVEPARQSFKCTLKTCPGSHGGTFVDLYALAKQVTPVVAAAEIAGALDLDVDPEWNVKIAEAMIEEAQQAIVRRDTEQAENAARLALQLKPDLVEARILLASIHAERGETLQAAEEYAALADSYLDTKQFEKADETLKSAVAAFPSSEDLILLQVKSAELQKKPDLVIRLLRELVEIREKDERHLDNAGLLEKLIKLEPKEPDHLIRLADVHERRHDLRSGTRSLEKAVKVLRDSKRGAEAIPLLHRIIQIEPELAKFRLALSEELIAEGDYPAAKEQIFEVVNLQIEQQDFGAAASTVQKWLEIEPESMEAHEALARIYMDQERHAEAASELRLAAQILRKDGNAAQAIQFLFRVKFLTPDDIEVRREIIDHFKREKEGEKAGFELLDLAEVHFAADDQEAGEQALKEAAEADSSAELQAQVADALTSRGRGEAAAEMLQKILTGAEKKKDQGAIALACERLLQIRPEDVGLLEKRCRALWTTDDKATAAEETADALEAFIKAGRWEAAREFVELGAKSATEYSDANRRLFEAAVERQMHEVATGYYTAIINGLAEVDADAALQCARKMAQANPEHTSALNDVAVLFATLGRHVEAAEAYLEMADRLAEKGDREGALHLLEEAANQAPNRLDVYRRRAGILAEVHGAEAALPLFQEYLTALREVGDPEESAEGLLAYIQWYPEDFAVQVEAADTLVALGRSREASERFAWLAGHARQQSDLTAALEHQRRATQLLPSSPENHQMLARDLLLTEAVADAVAEFIAAADIFAEEQMLDEALAAVREAVAADESSNEATEIALKIAKQTGNEVELRWAYEKSARQLQAAGHIPDALQRTREWLQIASQDVAGQWLLADLQAESGDTELALATYSALAENLEQEKRYVEALAVHAEMGQLRAPELHTLRRLAGLAEKSGDAGAKQNAQVQLGTALVRVGELDEAREIAKKLSSGKGRTARAGDIWQKLAQAKGTGEEAFECWLHAAEAYSISPETQQDVFDCLHSLLALDPDSAEAHERLIEYHSQRGEEDFAFSHRVALLPVSIPAGREKSWKAEWAKLLEQCEASASRHFELGIRTASAGRVRETLTCFEKACDLALATGEPQLVVDICSTDETLTAQSKHLKLARASALFEMEQFADAQAWLKQCADAALQANAPAEAETFASLWVERDKTNPVALELLATTYAKLNRTQRAGEVYLQLANLFQTADEPAEAARVLRQFLDIDQENVAARQLLWHVLLEAKRENDALEEMHQLAELLIEKNQYKEATTLLSRILDYRTNSEDTLERLASLVYENEGFDKASPYFRKLLALRRETLPAADVAAEYEKVLKLNGADINLRIEFAEYLQETERSVEAKKQLLLIAQAFRDELSDSARAIEYFERATSVQPASSDARVYEEIAEIHQARQEDPEAAKALRSAARILNENGEGKRAIEILERLLEIPLEADRTEDYAALATAYSVAGNTRKAADTFNKVFKAVVSPECALSEDRRAAILEELLVAQPGNVECVLALLPLLDPVRAGERAIGFARTLRETNPSSEDELRVLKEARNFARNHLPLRFELVSAYENRGNFAKSQFELSELVRVAHNAGMKEVAREALVRLNALPSNADLHLLIAPLCAMLGDIEDSILHYTKTAELLSETGQAGDAAEVLREAAQIDSASVPAGTVATLVRAHPEKFRALALELLEAALVARTRTRSLVIAAALLETSDPKETEKLLSLVFGRSGAAFLSAIAGAHADWLLERKRTEDASSIVKWIIELAPNSPDIWWLASQLRRRSDDKQGSAEAALKAAQLYNEAGAVTEEESCYREALEDMPDDAATLETLAFFYEREKRADEGVEAMRRLADLARQGNDSAGELQWLKKAVELNPGADAIRYRYSECLSAAGRKDQALDQFLETGRRSAKAGGAELAKSAYEKALELEPENEAAISFLLDAASKAGDSESISRFTLALAEIKSEAGAVTQAIQLLKTLLQHDPESEQALEKLSAMSLLAHDEEGFRLTASTLGHKLLKRGDYPGAMQQFENLLEQDPTNVETLQLLMDCCAAEGLNERGIQYAQRILDIAREGGKPESVRQAASNILAYNDDNADARRDMAEALLSLNRLTEAVAEWSRAGEQYQGKKQNEEALKCYRRIVQVAPTNLAAWRKLGDLSLTVGDSDAAMGAYSHLLESYADAGEAEKAHSIVGRLLQLDPEDVGLHEKALHVYRKIDNREQAMQAVLWLVKHHVNTGNYVEADRLVNVGIGIAPDSIALQQCQLEVIRKMGRTEELLTKLRKMTDQAIQEGKIETAAELLEQMRDTEPDRLEIRRELGDIRMKLDEVSDAIAEFSQMIRELLNRGETEEARETADSIAAQYNSELGIRARFGEVFTQEGFADIGARHYVACADLAAAVDDGSAKVHFLTLATEARPRWTDGLDRLAAASIDIGDKPAAANAYARLAAVHLDSRKYKEAVQALEKQIELTPRDPDPRLQLVDVFERSGNHEKLGAALKNLADLYISTGRADDAVEVYKQLTTVQPDNPDVLQRYIELFAQLGNELEIVDEYIKLAEAYAKAGKVQDAMQTFEQVLAIDRRNPDLKERYSAFLLRNGQKGRALTEMRKLAELYANQNELDAAVDVLHGAMALDPQNAEICLTLGAAQDAAGYHEDAIATYSRAAHILSGTTVMKAIDTYQRFLDKDENNAEVRSKLCDLLIRAGKKNEAASQARRLAETFSSLGKLERAEVAYHTASELVPLSLESLRDAIATNAYDPSLQYLDYIRYGDRLFEEGEVDKALDAYRQARALNDERPQVIQKCIDCLSQIAPEAEAIPDYLALAERHMQVGEPSKARKVYEHVAKLDKQNTDARMGLVAAIEADKNPVSTVRPVDDNKVLGRPERKKRVGLDELLRACQDAVGES